MDSSFVRFETSSVSVAPSVSEVFPEESFDVDSPAARSNTEIQSPALVGAKIQRGWVWSIEILFRCRRALLGVCKSSILPKYF